MAVVQACVRPRQTATRRLAMAMAAAEEHTESAAASKTPTRAIALLALAAFASAANLRVCDPLLPQIAGELGVTVGTAALTVTAFALAYGVFQVAVGPLSDARGRLNWSCWAPSGPALPRVVSASMPTLGPLVLLRFLAGAGAAAVIPVAIAWIGDVVPYERRQPVLARYVSGQILGIVFGQAAGGLLGELIGWRATLVVLGIVHMVAGLLLLGEMRRLKTGMPAPGRARWRHSAASAYSVLQDPLGAHGSDQRVHRRPGHVRRLSPTSGRTCTSASA